MNVNGCCPRAWHRVGLLIAAAGLGLVLVRAATSQTDPYTVGPPPRGRAPTAQPRDTRLKRADRPPATQPAVAGPQPSIKVDELVHDFGEVMSGQPVTHTFELTNVGEGELRISNVSTSCGCTVAKNWAKSAASGSTWEVFVTLRTTNLRSKVRKPVTVTTNDPKHRQIRFELTGTVLSRYKYEPKKMFGFGRIEKDTVAKRIVTITNQYDPPVIFKSAKVLHKSFNVELREIEKGRKYEVEVITVPPMHEGSTRGKITIETDLKEQPKLDLWASAYVAPRLALAPRAILIPNSPDRDATRVTTLRNAGPTPVHVKDVVSSDPAVSTRVETKTEGKEYRIFLTVQKGTKLPQKGYTVTVLTDDAEHPSLTVQVRPYQARRVRPAATTRPARPGTRKRTSQ